MQRIHVGQKSGFIIVRPEREVIIRDEKGMLFYSTEYKTPKVKEFNLPPGTYYLDKGAIKNQNAPIPYPLMPLPPKERNRVIPHGVPIKWGNNPNKCSIIWRTNSLGQVITNAPAKCILFDYSLADYTTPERDFIKFHEFSHANYVTEKYCDLKAANYMILKGYNPIQIGMSQIDSLSGAQNERKTFLVNMLIKTYGKYL